MESNECSASRRCGIDTFAVPRRECTLASYGWLLIECKVSAALVGRCLCEALEERNVLCEMLGGKVVVMFMVLHAAESDAEKLVNARGGGGG